MQEIQKNTAIHEIDWNNWIPHDIATLMFVVDGDNVLLIRKKRGLGAGKINAPGGKLDPGETIEQCATRELKEEVGLTVTHPTWCGENLFQFMDGYSMHVHVFISHTYTGTPIETDEAIPIWFNKTQLPYHEMWEDDDLWIPKMMKGTPFSGRYLFEGDKMLGHDIKLIKSSNPEII